MASYRIYDNLAWLNGLSSAEAESIFRYCCGSKKWAARMSAERPYPTLERLYTAAEAVWFSLTPADWLEAFAAHKIPASTKKPKRNDVSSTVFYGSGPNGGPVDEKGRIAELTEALKLYEAKFGFIFFVSSTGISAAELLEQCRKRLGNPMPVELRVAAEELLKVTEQRLDKVLER